MEFIRIRSPSKAPPVFLFEGSTETTAIFLFSKSTRNRRTNSSTKEDFPAPPVPVIPNTGTVLTEAISLISVSASACFSGKFSAAEIVLAIAGMFFNCTFLRSCFKSSPKP